MTPALRLTCHREELPTTTPVPPQRRPAAAAAAAAELNECRELLRYGGPLLRSPRMRRRYQDALKWAALYWQIDTKDLTP
jgi:hypothetical protein